VLSLQRDGETTDTSCQRRAIRHSSRASKNARTFLRAGVSGVPIFRQRGMQTADRILCCHRVDIFSC